MTAPRLDPQLYLPRSEGTRPGSPADRVVEPTRALFGHDSSVSPTGLQPHGRSTPLISSDARWDFRSCTSTGCLTGRWQRSLNGSGLAVAQTSPPPPCSMSCFGFSARGCAGDVMRMLRTGHARQNEAI